MRLPLLALLALTLASTGCQRHEPTDSSEGAPGSAAMTPGAQTPPAAATQSSATATPNDAAPPPAATRPEEPQAPNGFDLGVAQSADHGKYLVDGTGKTVYMLDKDSGTTSTCHDACAGQWPPLLAQQGKPKAMDASVDDGSIGVIQRNDGTQQVTYAGHPLYHYAHDTAAGQLNGAGKQDQFGSWSLLTPEGKPVAAH